MTGWASPLRFASRRLAAALRLYAQDTWSPPFPQPLPSDLETYLPRQSVLRLARRKAVRALNLAWHGQPVLLRRRIDPALHRRVLWLHQGTPQVGDSLCDLAARVLLKGQVERLDLLTDRHLLPLYQADDVFSKVASSAKDLSDAYDLVLLHSASSRSMRAKFESYRSLPFVHMLGYYTGPEFNRTLFGIYRMAQLLGSNASEAELQRLARPSMRASAAEAAAVDALALPPQAIAIAIGGVRGWRTYSRWPEVLRGLSHAGLNRPVVLVGSSNGLAMRDEILAGCGGRPLIDQVACRSLGETQEIVRRCSLAVCCDGGLLHVAHTTQTPVVALFAGIIEPRFRVTCANDTVCLHGAEAVDDIPAVDVVRVIMERLARPVRSAAVSAGK